MFDGRFITLMEAIQFSLRKITISIRNLHSVIHALAIEV